MTVSQIQALRTCALTPDCQNCAALCCVALHIAKSSKFALEKPAGIACPNLTETHHCKIHSTLEEKGFSGCIAYDCLGAGQRVVQDLHDGRSWQQAPNRLDQLSTDFIKMREIHSLLELLFATQALPLSALQQKSRDGFIARLFPQPSWSRTAFDAFPLSQTRKEVLEFLAQLKPLLSP